MASEAEKTISKYKGYAKVAGNLSGIGAGILLGLFHETIFPFGAAELRPTIMIAVGIIFIPVGILMGAFYDMRADELSKTEGK